MNSSLCDFPGVVHSGQTDLRSPPVDSGVRQIVLLLRVCDLPDSPSKHNSLPDDSLVLL